MTITETANRNYDATLNTMTATQMALTAHNLSPDATYARRADGSLWIWSDRRGAWIQIDFQENRGLNDFIDFC